MDNTEARSLLQTQLQLWRRRSYAELATEVAQSHRFEVIGQSGTWYQGHIRIFWDDEPNGLIRVIGSIDDGGWRAFAPLTDSFILAQDGTFVGE
jgi:hypothetical protein